MTFRVAAVLADSRVNGPGTRYTLWLQGCERRCDGCANAEFQPRLGGKLRAVAAVAEEILAAPRIDGVTISGGEPFDQADAVFKLIRRIRRRNDQLTFCVKKDFDVTAAYLFSLRLQLADERFQMSFSLL